MTTSPASPVSFAGWTERQERPKLDDRRYQPLVNAVAQCSAQCQLIQVSAFAQLTTMALIACPCTSSGIPTTHASRTPATRAGAISISRGAAPLAARLMIVIVHTADDIGSLQHQADKSPVCGTGSAPGFSRSALARASQY